MVKLNPSGNRGGINSTWCSNAGSVNLENHWVDIKRSAFSFWVYRMVGSLDTTWVASKTGQFMGPEGLVSYAWEHLAPTGALGSNLGSDRSSWLLATRQCTMSLTCLRLSAQLDLKNQTFKKAFWGRKIWFFPLTGRARGWDSLGSSNKLFSCHSFLFKYNFMG